MSSKIDTIHSISPVEIDIRSGRALSVSFCTMTSRFEYRGIEYDKVSTVRLISRLEDVHASQGPEWKLLTLECIYIRDRIVPIQPQPPDTIPSFEEAKKFKKACRYSARLLSTIGIESRKDLPNEEDRESVAEVFTRNHAWINTDRVSRWRWILTCSSCSSP